MLANSQVNGWAAPFTSQALLAVCTRSCEFKCRQGQRTNVKDSKKLDMCLLNSKDLLFSFLKKEQFFFKNEVFSRLSFTLSLLIESQEQRAIFLPVKQVAVKVQKYMATKKKKKKGNLQRNHFKDSRRMGTVMSRRAQAQSKGMVTTLFQLLISIED